MTYLWSKLPNPVIGSFITTSTLQASFSLGMVNFRSSWDRGRRNCPSSPWPLVNTDKGGAGPAWEQQQQEQGTKPTPARRAHADRGQVAFHSPGNLQQRGFSASLQGCQLIVQGGGWRMGPTMCPKILTCPFHFKLRQGGLSGQSQSF